MVDEKEAKLERDKGVLERAGGSGKINKITAIGGLGIPPENYDILALRERKVDYFRELVCEYDTWAEVKANFNGLKQIKAILGLSETDLKEIWRDELRKYRENERALRDESKKQISAAKIFTRLGQAEEFIKRQPVYYDKAKLWWIWNKERLCWELSDETDILNMINKELDLDVVTSKTKVEIMTALEMVARKNKPLDAEPTWIQFANGIVDINNPDSLLVPNSSYFVTNPIPWNYGDKEDTPTMDKIFAEWVGEGEKLFLYQILAYCLLRDYPIHRIFCFIGAGLNGKSCYLSLLRKFLGSENCCSTELDTLLNSRFEVTRLHKKLACQMGETNFSEMNKTSMLKKLSGGDLIGFEYKNKTPFDDRNYAKVIIATNNLPATTDKTIGFYRRWKITDFPNNFSEKKDILSEIPDEEYHNLGRKCVRILKELLEKREFHNEGSIEERMKKYEEKSNVFDKFFEDHIIETGTSDFITKHDFKKKLDEWCQEHRHRKLSDISINEKMKEKGILENRTRIEWYESDIATTRQVRVWEGIKWK